jgi:hypothetical protein
MLIWQVTNGFILWWKLILGIGMILVHTSMMKDRTIKHNHTRQKGELYPATEIGGEADAAQFRETEDGSLFYGRGQRYQTDADWRALKSLCQVVQWIHLAVFIPYWVVHGSGSARPLELVAMDGAAIALLSIVNFVRFVCYTCKWNHLFWIVRSRKSSKKGGYNSVSVHAVSRYGWCLIS